MDEEDDLYGDLETKAKTAEAQLLQERVKSVMKENKALVAETNEYKEQLRLLCIEKSQVEENMITLYNTAIRELDRKEKEISDLRSEIERLNKNKPL
mmetsp:Transcript_8646/g.12916  ORF Transcript_8646/g.12916 Transcript_8646/m.12916 type:complete len:97 (+) Transcript_8646:46-336(+)